MAQRYKLVFRYGAGLYGWTELFYTTFEFDSADEAADYYANDQYPAARMACSPYLVGMLSVTAYDLENERLSATVPVNMRGTFNSPGNPPDLEYPEVSAVLAAAAENGRSRKLFVGGLPDSGVTSRLSPLGVVESWPTSDMEDRLDELCRVIRERGFSIRGKVPATGAWRWRPVVSLGPTADKYTRIALAPDDTVGLEKGQKIYFRGLNQCRYPFLRGELEILEVLTPAVHVQIPWDLDVAAALQEAPTAVRLLQYEYGDITTCKFQKMGDHDRGKPTGLPRGRSSGKTCRRSTPVVE